MSAPKLDVNGALIYASTSMRCAHEIPGYNGTLYAIDEDVKERIERELDASGEMVKALIDALSECVIDMMQTESYYGNHPRAQEVIKNARAVLARIGGAA